MYIFRKPGSESHRVRLDPGEGFVGKQQPRTKEDLQAAIRRVGDQKLTVDLCNWYIDHVFKVAPVCIELRGHATGDLPKKIFREPSAGKSFAYFAERIQTPRLGKGL